MFYGAVVWDPWLIVAQIVCLQCLYYLTLGFFLSFLVGTRVSRLTLVYFFDFATITTSTVTGWCVIASLLLTSIAGAGYMLYLIERAKKCLDFSATLYIIHLFICIIYGGWPSSITWWAVNGTGLAVMALLGEYLCIRRELLEIPITRRSSKKLLYMLNKLHKKNLIHEISLCFIPFLVFILWLCPVLCEDGFLWGVN
ncbi:unnamed protein product [Dovyalis caffra]|uniref:Protein SYS1 homolog n=1 Tax=Dovyalis caffra TaxID=77055 RepID=A0AAV1SVN1_9ROSI|nr:unnamed protein product [Dovyalis caffra]